MQALSYKLWQVTDCWVPVERRPVLDARGEEETADEDVTWNVNAYTESSCKLDRCFLLFQREGSSRLTVACYTTENSTFSINADSLGNGSI